MSVSVLVPMSMALSVSMSMSVSMFMSLFLKQKCHRNTKKLRMQEKILEGEKKTLGSQTFGMGERKCLECGKNGVKRTQDRGARKEK